VKIRAELHINGGMRKPYLVTGPNEPDEHLAHKLAAYILFWNDEPMLDATSRLPALANFEFVPDLLALDDSGDAKLWVECSSITHHKLTKITRRAPNCRIVVIKEYARDAARLRQELTEQFDRPERVEIFGWPDGAYKQWLAAVGDKVEVFGEADGRMINAVVNETPLVVEFESY
jgi:uncharacterized protein YaeQ